MVRGTCVSAWLCASGFETGAPPKLSTAGLGMNWHSSVHCELGPRFYCLHLLMPGFSSLSCRLGFLQCITTACPDPSHFLRSFESQMRGMAKWMGGCLFAASPSGMCAGRFGSDLACKSSWGSCLCSADKPQGFESSANACFYRCAEVLQIALYC